MVLSVDSVVTIRRPFGPSHFNAQSVVRNDNWGTACLPVQLQEYLSGAAYSICIPFACEGNCRLPIVRR